MASAFSSTVGAPASTPTIFLGKKVKNYYHGGNKMKSRVVRVMAAKKELDQGKQTDADRWKGLAYDISDDQQDITRGKGIVDSLFQAPMGDGTHEAILSSYEYISQGLRKYDFDNTMDGLYIAPAFMDKLIVHLAKNFMTLPNIKVPLILGIWGGKGQGKSFQCELVFAKMGINPIMMSAGELESGNAGEPAKLIRQRYREAVASKNLYELLGNDLELDPNREPEPPVKVIDKPVQRTGKRNAGAEPKAAAGQVPAATNNRSERRDDGLRADRHANRTREPRDPNARGRGGRGRGGRGADGNRAARTARDDRHSHTGIGEHEKQAGHGWGKVEGQAEWSDEKAGADIAATEVKDAAGNTEPEVAAAPEPEEEDNTKSYEQYLADLAEKRQALAGDSLAIRKANEGSTQKFPEGKPVERTHEEYFAGAGAKQHRAKENKTKNSLALDGQYYAAPDTGDRSRGGARGGRGEGRGGRGRGEGRGRGGRGRGEGRGAPSGARTEQRSGPRGGAINTKDEAAFPSLGA